MPGKWARGPDGENLSGLSVGPEDGLREEEHNRYDVEHTGHTGTPGIEREEGESSSVQPNEELAVGVSRKAGIASGTGGEEDWTSMSTGDPAFWLKD